MQSLWLLAAGLAFALMGVFGTVFTAGGVGLFDTLIDG